MMNRKSTSAAQRALNPDRKSTRLNSSHHDISYAVFCLKTSWYENSVLNWKMNTTSTRRKTKTGSGVLASGLCLTALLISGAVAPAAEKEIKVKAGEFVIDPPTLINLGFEWVIQGDDNRNATVEVSYRKQGDAQWKQGLPLTRLQGERIYQDQGVFDVISPNMFAGSILDLEPDTTYETRFVMSDPDGFVGQNGKIVTKTVTVRTRPEPKPYAGGRVFHVYPPDYKGTKIEPAFDAVMCAYNYYCGGGDRVVAGRPRVKAGDTILV